MNGLQHNDAVVTFGNYYSVTDLAAFKLPGFPRSKKGWYSLVAQKVWGYRDVEGSGGKGGIRREYTPPPEVQALIEARQRGESLPVPERQPVPPRVVALSSKPASGALDSERLRLAIETVEEGLAATHTTMAPAKKADLVLAVYELFEESGVNKERVLKLVKFAA